jgi:hypothetical protein
MNILNRGLLMLFISLLLLQTACTNQEPPVIAENFYPVLSNTKWHYMDSDWEYDMEFLSNGTLRTEHPNDKTPNNDTWKQQDGKVYFYFNDKYSAYQGNFSGSNMISGSAKSKTGVMWNWKAVRKQNLPNFNK